MVACAVAWLCITVGYATTVVAPTFEEMVDRADLVFVGKVASSRADWRTAGTNRVIFTRVEFENEETLKGKAGASLTLQFLGGTVGDMTLQVADVPRFNAGDRVLLFVEGNGAQFCPLVGVFHGKFGLRKDERSGREFVLMHDGNPLRDVAQIGRGDEADLGSKQSKLSTPPDRDPMSVDDFKVRIRSRLAKTAARK